MERCDLLGQISEKPDLLVRPFGSDAMRQANHLVASWTRDAGMAVRRDAIGNLIGRYEGRDPGTRRWYSARTSTRCATRASTTARWG
jgi:allantoate deiminase